GHAVDERPHHASDVVAPGRLHLDDVGAEIGEVCGQRAGTEHRHVDDPDPGQRSWRVGHAGPPFPRRSSFNARRRLCISYIISNGRAPAPDEPGSPGATLLTAKGGG